MFIPMRNFGKFGVVTNIDNDEDSLPVGTWGDALNMRFSGIELEKMLEPTKEMDFGVLGYSCSAFIDALREANPK
ncbi:MAG: hypothetical protein ACPH5V_02645, partial [Alcanivorax sp.]